MWRNWFQEVKDPEKLKKLFEEDQKKVVEKIQKELSAIKKTRNTDILPAADLEASIDQFFQTQQQMIEQNLTRYMQPEHLTCELYSQVLQALRNGIIEAEIQKNEKQIEDSIIEFISKVDLTYFMRIGYSEGIRQADHRQVVSQLSFGATVVSSFFKSLEESYQNTAKQAANELKSTFRVSKPRDAVTPADQVMFVNRACEAIYFLGLEIREQLSTKWVCSNAFTDDMKEFSRARFQQELLKHIWEKVRDPAGFDAKCSPKAIYKELETIKEELKQTIKLRIPIQELPGQPSIRAGEESLRRFQLTKDNFNTRSREKFGVDVSESVYLAPAWEELSEYQERTIREALQKEATAREKMAYSRITSVMQAGVERLILRLSESRPEPQNLLQLLGHEFLGMSAHEFRLTQAHVLEGVRLAAAYCFRKQERESLMLRVEAILGAGLIEDDDSRQSFFLLSPQAQMAHQVAEQAHLDTAVPCELSFDQAILMALSVYILCADLSSMLESMPDRESEMVPRVGHRSVWNAIARGLKCLHSRLGFVRTTEVLNIADMVLGAAVRTHNTVRAAVGMRHRYVHIDINHSLSVLRGLKEAQKAETFDLFDAAYGYPTTDESKQANLLAGKQMQTLLQEVKVLALENCIKNPLLEKCEGSLSKLLVIHGFSSQNMDLEAEYERMSAAFSSVEGLALRWPSSSKHDLLIDISIAGLAWMASPWALAGWFALDIFRESQRVPESPLPTQEFVNPDGTADFDWRDELGTPAEFKRHRKTGGGLPEQVFNIGFYVAKRPISRVSNLVKGVHTFYQLASNSFDFSKQITHKVAHCLALTLDRLRLLNSCFIHLKGFSLGSIITLATLELLYDRDTDFSIGDVLLVGSVFPLEVFYDKVHIFIGHRSALGGVLTIAYSGSDFWVGFDRWVMDPLRFRGFPCKLGNFPIDFNKVTKSLMKNDPDCKLMTEEQVRKFANYRLRSIRVHDIAKGHEEVFERADLIAHRTDFIHRL